MFVQKKDLKHSPHQFRNIAEEPAQLWLFMWQAHTGAGSTTHPHTLQGGQHPQQYKGIRYLHSPGLAFTHDPDRRIKRENRSAEKPEVTTLTETQLLLLELLMVQICRIASTSQPPQISTQVPRRPRAPTSKIGQESRQPMLQEPTDTIIQREEKGRSG
jgi:hypothetical protein